MFSLDDITCVIFDLNTPIKEAGSKRGLSIFSNSSGNPKVVPYTSSPYKLYTLVFIAVLNLSKGRFSRQKLQLLFSINNLGSDVNVNNAISFCVESFCMNSIHFKHIGFR